MNLENIKRKKPVIKDHIMYDSIYMKCPDLTRQVHYQLLGVSGVGMGDTKERKKERKGTHQVVNER